MRLEGAGRNKLTLPSRTGVSFIDCDTVLPIQTELKKGTEMGAHTRSCLLLLLFASSPALQAQTQTVDFEEFAGPSLFDSIQPPLHVLSATFSGGQILTNATFLPVDPTTVYGTADFCAGCLPVISIDFSQKVSNVSLLLMNGRAVTVTYTVEDDQGGVRQVVLPPNLDSGAEVVTLPEQNIRHIDLSGDDPSWDFLIDNVSFTLSGPVLIDPVAADLLRGATVTTDTALLSADHHIVKGVAAEGSAEVVVRIPASQEGVGLTITVFADSGAASSSTDDDGGLVALGGNAGAVASDLDVTAVSTPEGPMAFAIYRAPRDFSRGAQDDGADQRQITLRVMGDGGSTSQTAVLVVRPPVVLVHGLWDSEGAWDGFTPLVSDSRFFIRRASFSGAVDGITASLPAYDTSKLANVHENALGFAYNSSSVLTQLRNFIVDFCQGENVAAVQADVIGHSMGGDIARTMVLAPSFLSNDSYDRGPIHKLITIGTPHLGTPLATQILDDANSCVRKLLADHGKFSLTAVVLSGSAVRGAVGDLQGDGRGGGRSAALRAFKAQQPFPTAYIAGAVSNDNLAGLDCGFPCSANLIRLDCSTFASPANPLAQDLTSSKWPDVFGQASDAIVPQTSQLNGGSGFLVNGVVHSLGVEDLSFKGPAELDEASTIPAKVIDLLNERSNGTDFHL
jgi:pimeloyl-ACP methyl ester carboxylesterase